MACVLLFYVKFWKLLGGFMINAYLCIAKIHAVRRCLHHRWHLLYLLFIVTQPHWGSSVEHPKGLGGFACVTIATRNAAPYLLQIRL